MTSQAWNFYVREESLSKKYKIRRMEGGTVSQVCVCQQERYPWSLIPGPFPVLWSHVLSGGYPSPVTGSVQSPVAGRAGRYPNLGRGVPPCTGQNQDGCAVRAVYLLYSRRRTFLFQFLVSCFMLMNYNGELI